MIQPSCGWSTKVISALSGYPILYRQQTEPKTIDSQKSVLPRMLQCPWIDLERDRGLPLMQLSKHASEKRVPIAQGLRTVD